MSDLTIGGLVVLWCAMCLLAMSALVERWARRGSDARTVAHYRSLAGLGRVDRNASVSRDAAGESATGASDVAAGDAGLPRVEAADYRGSTRLTLIGRVGK